MPRDRTSRIATVALAVIGAASIVAGVAYSSASLSQSDPPINPFGSFESPIRLGQSGSAGPGPAQDVEPVTRTVTGEAEAASAPAAPSDVFALLARLGWEFSPVLLIVVAGGVVLGADAWSRARRRHRDRVRHHA